MGPLIAAAGASVEPTTVPGLFVLQGPTASIGQLAEKLMSNPAIQFAVPSQTESDQTLPNDPNFTSGGQWYLNGGWGINAPQAWSVTVGSDQVVVADTDTGIAYNAPDLYGSVWINQAEIPSSVLPNLTDVGNDGAITFTDLNAVVNGVKVNQGPGKIQDTNGDGIITATDLLAPTSAGGWASASTQDGDTADPDDLIGWNYVNNTNNPVDQDGHGTFTAGEIGAVTNNGIGVAGTVWNAQVMPVQFLDSTGNGSDAAAVQAIEYAVNHGAKIINASWGGSGVDPTIATAIQYANQHNVIIVAAAGNSGTNDDTSFFAPASYSAQYPNLISVAAISNNGVLASWSNYGTGTVQLAAPGVGLLGVGLNGTYVGDSGTSMAAPLVAGTLALVEAAHPTWSMSQVIDAVLDHTTPDAALQGKVATGGIVNAGAAVANTSGPYVIAASPDGSVNNSGGLSSIQLTFNEEVNPATLTPSQATLAGPGGTVSGLTITPVSGSNDHRFLVSFPAQTTAGTYTLSVGTGVEDWYGNALNQNRNGVNGEGSDVYVETIRQTAPGASDLLSVTGIPSGGGAGTSESFTVTALSPNGGTDTSYVGTIQFSSTDSQLVLPNYTFTAANAGTHTFNVTFKTAGVQSITATDTVNGNIIGTEENIVVQSAAASVLKIGGFTSPDTAGTTQTVSVTAYDAYGNVATDYGGLVHFTSSDSQATLPANYTVPPELQGTFTFNVTLKTAGTQSITVTDTTTSSLTATESGIVVQDAPLSTLAVAGFPSSVTAGTTANFTVGAVDAYGNVIPGYLGTVQFTSNDSQAGLPSSYKFVAGDNGKHTFSATLKTAGSVILRATDTTLNIAGIESVSVRAGATTQIKVSGIPGNDTAGVAGTVTVTAVDLYGNLTASYTGTVSLSSSDPQAVLPPSYTFTTGDSGKHTFPVTLKTAGTQSVTATDTSNFTGSQTGISVKAAAASTLKVTGFPVSGDAAGSIGSITVAASDAYGNLVTSYTGKVTLSSSDPQAVLPPAYTFVAADAGKHSFSVTLKSAGTQSITATDTSNFTGTESNIAVQASSVQSFRATGFPTSDTAGSPGSIAVTAYDAYGNVATGFTGSVSLSSSDSQAVLAPAYTYGAGDGGTHSFAVTLETVGTQSITATTTQNLTASETNIVVKAAAASTLVVTGFPASDTAGTAGSVVVTAYDPYGNLATGYAGTVTLSSSDPGAVLPSPYVFVSGDAGKHTFLVTLKTAGTQSIAATAATNLTGSEPNILVKPAAASTLTVTGFPSPDSAGVATNLTVTAYDPYGNVATGYAGTIAFASSDSHAGLPANFTFVAANQGTYTFSATLKTAGTQYLKATDTTTSSITGTEPGIVVQPAGVQSLAITGFPATVTASAANNFTVTAYDPYGNVTTGYTGTVQFTSTDPSAGLPANYTFTSGNAGTHTFTATLNTVGMQTIYATDTMTASVKGSASATVSSTLTSTAAIVKSDTTTEGNWEGVYGTQGYDIVSGPTSLPAGDTITPTGQLTYNWATATTDPRALQVPGSPNRVAAVWYSPTSFSVDVNLGDGVAHDLELYLLDWSLSGRAETVQITDATTGAVLTSQTISSFGSGEYLDYVVSGHIKITITNIGPANAVLNGLFLDPKAAAATAATAVAVKQDTTTHGTWIGTYGASGYDIVSGPTSLPAGDTITPTGQLTYTWTTASTDPRALQVPGSPNRVAAVWYSPTSFNVDVNLGDGVAHDLELYLLDWDNKGRAETVQITDATTGAVLTSQTISSFGSGEYLDYVVSGHIKITITNIGPANAVLDGLFLDPSSGAASQLTVSAPTAVTAGSAFSVTAKSSNGNVATGYIGIESGIVVQPAGAQSLAITGFPTPDTAGVASNFIVTAYDPYRNVATGYLGTVSFSSSDSTAGLPPTYTLVASDNGSHTFVITLNTKGSQSITLIDSANKLSGSDTGIIVQ